MKSALTPSRNLYAGLVAVAMTLGLSSVSANANAIQIDWYAVSPSFADFNLAPCGPQNCGQHFTNAVGTSLVGGLPVVSAANPAGYTEGVGNQLQWWTPQVGVTSQGTTIQSLPLNQNMFISQGTGSNDGSFFQTAIITATVHVGGALGSITFGGDDDMFLALNGQVVAQDGGIHPVGVTTTYNFLAAGDYLMQVFYADRHVTDAHALLEVSGDVTTSVPEPSTWAMMVLGFAGLGFMTYRRRKSVALVA